MTGCTPALGVPRDSGCRLHDDAQITCHDVCRLSTGETVTRDGGCECGATLGVDPGGAPITVVCTDGGT